MSNTKRTLKNVMLRSSLSATALAAFFVFPVLITPSIAGPLATTSIEQGADESKANMFTTKFGDLAHLQPNAPITASKDIKISFDSPVILSIPSPPKPKPVVESVPASPAATPSTAPQQPAATPSTAPQQPAATPSTAPQQPATPNATHQLIAASPSTTVAQAQAFAKQLLVQRGLDTASNDANFVCLVDLWNRESGWNYQAANPSSGAYGIPQSLPGNKMAAAGADWQTNANTQIIWGLDYIMERYGSPCNAHAIWLKQHWY